MNTLTIKALAVICAAYTAGVVTPTAVKRIHHRPKAAVARQVPKPPKLSSPAEPVRIDTCFPSQQIAVLPPVALPDIAEQKPLFTAPPRDTGPWFGVPGSASAGGVPEPESWMMLIAGLGLVGAVRRRRGRVLR